MAETVEIVVIAAIHVCAPLVNLTTHGEIEPQVHLRPGTLPFLVTDFFAVRHAINEQAGVFERQVQPESLVVDFLRHGDAPKTGWNRPCRRRRRPSASASASASVPAAAPGACCPRSTQQFGKRARKRPRLCP